MRSSTPSPAQTSASSGMYSALQAHGTWWTASHRWLPPDGSRVLVPTRCRGYGRDRSTRKMPWPTLPPIPVTRTLCIVVCTTSCLPDLCAYRVGRLLHHPKVHAGQVLADDPQREQLGARKQGDDRGKEGEARNATPQKDAPADGVHQDPDPEQRESEADEAGQLEWTHAESRHHVHGVGHEAPKRVVRRTDEPRSVVHAHRAEARRAPGEQH